MLRPDLKNVVDRTIESALLERIGRINDRCQHLLYQESTIRLPILLKGLNCLRSGLAVNGSHSLIGRELEALAFCGGNLQLHFSIYFIPPTRADFVRILRHSLGTQSSAAEAAIRVLSKFCSGNSNMMMDEPQRLNYNAKTLLTHSLKLKYCVGFEYTNRDYGTKIDRRLILKICIIPLDTKYKSEEIIAAQKKAICDVVRELVRYVNSPNTIVGEQKIVIVST